MGCDIHLRVQKFVDDKWTFAEERIADKYEPTKTTHERWYDGRNYRLFGMLANVRNGIGFAGVDTGDAFRFISEPRGLPDGMAEYIGEIRDKDGSVEDYDFWFGDHSHSWLTLPELIDFDWYQSTKCRGWVNGPQFEEWDRMKEWESEPREHCGGVSGGNVTHISETEMRQRLTEIKQITKPWSAAEAKIKDLYSSTYCLVEWPMFYSEAAGKFYTQTMPRMFRLAKQVGGPENVRIVFGFDS